MKKGIDTIKETESLRQKAEDLLKKKHPKVDAHSSENDVRRLVHELQVHQIELEMQNEELVLAKEQIAAAANEKYKELYDFAPSGFFTLSRKGNIVELNLNGAGMLGKERQRLIHLNFKSFITPDSRVIFEDFLHRIFISKTNESCEITLSNGSGKSSSFVYIAGHVIEDQEQCLLSLVDITDRKNAEAELHIKMEELTRAYKQLEDYSFHNKELKQFAYISSHELQQPLRTISNFIQIVEEDYSRFLDENAHKYLHIIKDAAKRMYTLINALSDYSKLGMNKSLDRVDFRELINNVIADMHAAIQSSGAVIEVSEMPLINAFAVEIQQVFQNLIANAIKFHRKGFHPQIHLGSEKTEETWRFSVTDNGIGIDPSHFGKLFNMFQRLHQDESEYEGKGIGLTICKKVIEMHQGEIWVEPNKDHGVTFCFTIPNLAL